MKMRSIFLVSSLMFAGLANAATYISEATHNITVQPGGPRGGNNGLNFMNVEGWINGSFSSYGMAEFSGGQFGAPTLSSIDNVRVWMLTVNAAFSADGDVFIGLVRNNTLNLNQAANSPVNGQPKSPLIFDLAAATAMTDETGINGQFTYEEVGSIPYKVSDGTLHRYAVDLTLDASQKTYIRDQINAKQPIRFAIFAKDAVTAGTFAGYSYSLGVSPNFVPTISEMVEVNTTATQPKQAGLVKLSADYVGAKSKRSVKVYLYDTSNLVTPVEVVQGSNLNEQGLFSLSTNLVGDYVVKVKASTWLSKNLGTITLTGNPQVLPLADQLINGDCDDNNIINTDDYLVLSGAFDKAPGDEGYVDSADLDGNNYINTDDYLILSFNFDQSGE